MVLRYVERASKRLVGRELASFFHKLSRGLRCQGFCLRPAKDAAEELPVDTPGLHEVRDLIEVFVRTRECQSGSFRGVRLKAQWNAHRILLGARQLIFDNELLMLQMHD